MGLLDGLLGQVAGNVDLKNLASQVGLSPEQAEMAIAALPGHIPSRATRSSRPRARRGFTRTRCSRSSASSAAKARSGMSRRCSARAARGACSARSAACSANPDAEASGRLA